MIDRVTLEEVRRLRDEIKRLRTVLEQIESLTSQKGFWANGEATMSLVRIIARQTLEETT